MDTTWHLTDTLSILRGRHQWKLGGEVRVARLDVFNEINKRGTFTFDGSAGPWSTGTPEQRALGATFSQPERVLADFLGGYVSPNSGARTSRGNLARALKQNSWDLFVHDSWQVTPTLNINYGVRYTFLGVLRNNDDSLTTFLPEAGIVAPGTPGLERLYPHDWNNIAPRLGLAWQPSSQSSWTLRAGYGIYYDLFHITYFASNSPSNSGASGVNANPGGREPVFNLSRGGFQLVPNEPVFGGVTPAPPFGAYSVSQDLRTPYVQNYHAAVQRQIGKASAQLSYVGSAGWTINTFISAHTGLPLDIRAGTNVSNSFDGADRVDLVGHPFANIVQPANSTSRRFFNAAAFARPADGDFGNIGRNALPGPGFAAIDFSVFKSTAITERVAADFRVEVFNLFNRTNWANPGTSRSIQLALKLRF